MKPNRRGRPRLPPDEKRSAVLAVRLTKEEKAEVLVAAKGRGVALATWIREAVLAALGDWNDEQEGE